MYAPTYPADHRKYKMNIAENSDISIPQPLFTGLAEILTHQNYPPSSGITGDDVLKK